MDVELAGAGGSDLVFRRHTSQTLFPTVPELECNHARAFAALLTAGIKAKLVTRLRTDAYVALAAAGRLARRDWMLGRLERSFRRFELLLRQGLPATKHPRRGRPRELRLQLSTEVTSSGNRGGLSQSAGGGVAGAGLAPQDMVWVWSGVRGQRRSMPLRALCRVERGGGAVPVDTESKAGASNDLGFDLDVETRQQPTLHLDNLLRVPRSNPTGVSCRWLSPTDKVEAVVLMFQDASTAQLACEAITFALLVRWPDLGIWT